MYLERHVAVPLRRAVHSRQPVLVQGPRGAGKTALARHEFPDHAYVTLDDPAVRRDPAEALRRLRGPAIIDAVHRAPGVIDGGSAHIYLSSLRLAADIPTLELHPPTRAERQRRAALPLETIGRFAPSGRLSAGDPPPWPSNRAFLDLDLPALIHVHDRARFERFLAVAEARSGAVLDQQALAREAAVSHRTVVRWLEVLRATFQIVLLEPYGESFGRRVVRRPKMHFLSGVESFESEVVSEIYRNARHAGLEAEFCYWRDSNGLEVALVVDGIPVGLAAEGNPKAEAAALRWAELAGLPHAAMITRRPPLLGRRAGRLLRYAIGQI